MINASSLYGVFMSNEENSGLRSLYGQLGQILDGLWFVELEKRVGFEQAYAIDEAVWLSYGRKEVRKIKTFLGITEINLKSLTRIFRMMLFNQTLQFTLSPIDEDPRHIRFEVYACKTYEGMCHFHRSNDQIAKICFGIEMAYFGAALEEISPGTEFKCIRCPQNDQYLEGSLCAWEILLPP
jgi:hypothetical protein